MKERLIEAQMELEEVWGDEWTNLSEDDQYLVIEDYLHMVWEEGWISGEGASLEYVNRIFPGNLSSYVEVLRVKADKMEKMSKERGRSFVLQGAIICRCCFDMEYGPWGYAVTPTGLPQQFVCEDCMESNHPAITEPVI
jgi:hypothetical protein